MATLLRSRLRPMNPGDIAQIMDIERESFTSMWPQTAYRRELQNKLARYFVIVEPSDPAQGESQQAAGLFGALRRIVGGEGARPDGEERILGFIGLWLMVGEGHIVTIAVRQHERRRGIGERLLIACVEEAIEFAQEVVTLEVRKSNDAAQQLYLKYGFDRVGLRVRYYTDDNEDAVIMTTPNLAAPGFNERFGALKAQHRALHPDLWG